MIGMKAFRFEVLWVMTEETKQRLHQKGMKRHGEVAKARQGYK